MRGKTQVPGHIANWIECVRTRATPTAPPEIGYRSAIAVHMANLSYKRKQRITLEEASKRIDHILTVLQFIDRVELTQRSDPGRAILTLRVRLAEPLR